MGNSSYVVDLRGFEAVHPCNEAVQAIDFALREKDRDAASDFVGDTYPSLMTSLYDKLVALGVDSVLADQATGKQPLAVGWMAAFKEATPGRLDALRVALKEAGFKVTPLEKDRFLTYG